MIVEGVQCDRCGAMGKLGEPARAMPPRWIVIKSSLYAFTSAPLKLTHLCPACYAVNGLEVSDGTKKCRVEVAEFAQAMERKLAANDYKGGWKECKLDYLFMRISQEMEELRSAAYRETSRSVSPAQPSRRRVLDEAADVGNVAMMIADVCGALTEQTDSESPPKPEARILCERCNRPPAMEDTRVSEPCQRTRPGFDDGLLCNGTYALRREAVPTEPGGDL